MISESLSLTLTHILIMPSPPSSVQVVIRKFSRTRMGNVLRANCVPRKNVACFASAGIVRESGHAQFHKTASAHSPTVLSGLLCSLTNGSVIATVRQKDAPFSGPVQIAKPCSHTME